MGKKVIISLIILGILLLGALSYVFFFPKKFIPEQCSVPGDVTCSNFSISKNDVIFVFKNNLDRDVNSVRLSIEHCKGRSIIYRLRPGESSTAIVSECLFPVITKNKIDGEIIEKTLGELNISYADSGPDKYFEFSGNLSGTLVKSQEGVWESYFNEIQPFKDELDAIEREKNSFEICEGLTGKECCLKKGNYWLRADWGHGCYENDYNEGCEGGEGCGHNDNCCPNWCGGGTDPQC